jgi:L-amino acid N-acyltransferase YncA
MCLPQGRIDPPEEPNRCDPPGLLLSNLARLSLLVKLLGRYDQITRAGTAGEARESSSETRTGITGEAHESGSKRGAIGAEGRRTCARAARNGGPNNTRGTTRSNVPDVNGERNEVSTIRDAQGERDAAGCLEIYAPYVRDTAVSFEERVPTPGEFLARVQEVTATHPWLVFEEAGRIAGFAYGSQHRARAAYRWAADVTVYVAPSHHRRGAGRRLYEELMRRLRHQGLRVACAGITLPNEASIGLHRTLGFEPVGVYRRIGFKHGAWQDVSWWQLELEPADESPPREPRKAASLAP